MPGRPETGKPPKNGGGAGKCVAVGVFSTDGDVFWAFTARLPLPSVFRNHRHVRLLVTL